MKHVGQASLQMDHVLCSVGWTLSSVALQQGHKWT